MTPTIGEAAASRLREVLDWSRQRPLRIQFSSDEAAQLIQTRVFEFLVDGFRAFFPRELEVLSTDVDTWPICATASPLPATCSPRADPHARQLPDDDTRQSPQGRRERDGEKATALGNSEWLMRKSRQTLQTGTCAVAGRDLRL